MNGGRYLMSMELVETVQLVCKRRMKKLVKLVQHLHSIALKVESVFRNSVELARYYRSMERVENVKHTTLRETKELVRR